MSEWNRTALLCASPERIEAAIGYYAAQRGLTRETFVPKLITEVQRDQLWRSSPHNAHVWIVALRDAGASMCVVKTIPLDLLSEAQPGSTSRPMLASLCLLLTCQGAMTCDEDSGEMNIVSDASGSVLIDGLHFAEGECAWEFQATAGQPGDNSSPPTDVTEFGLQWPAELTARIKHSARTIIESAAVAVGDVSDSVQYSLINCDRAAVPQGWRISMFVRNGRRNDK